VDVEREALVLHLRAARTEGPHGTGRCPTAGESRAVGPPADSRRTRAAASACVGLTGAAALCGARQPETETPDHGTVASVACVWLGVAGAVSHSRAVKHRDAQLGSAVSIPPRATATSCRAGREPHEPARESRPQTRRANWAKACRHGRQVALNSTLVFTQRRARQQEHYSTRTVDATSEYSQQGWCGVCFMWFGKGVVVRGREAIRFILSLRRSGGGAPGFADLLLCEPPSTLVLVIVSEILASLSSARDQRPAHSSSIADAYCKRETGGAAPCGQETLGAAAARPRARATVQPTLPTTFLYSA
jgi:hypothetical protein